MKERALFCYVTGIAPKDDSYTIVVGPCEDLALHSFETFGEVDGLVVRKITSGGRDVITEPTPLADLNNQKISFECSAKENIVAIFQNDAAEKRTGGLRIVGSAQ